MYRVQASEGCDYTIGCGLSVDELKADNLRAAREETRREILFGGSESDEDLVDPDTDDHVLSEAYIIPHDSMIEIDLDALHREARSIIESIRSANRDTKERVEFERLKKKFG